MKETELTKAIIKELNQRGFLVWKHWQGQFSKKGISDILGMTPRGQFLAIEVKSGLRYKITTHQQAFLDEVKTQGGLAMVAYGVNDCLEKLKDHLAP